MRRDRDVEVLVLTQGYPVRSMFGMGTNILLGKDSGNFACEFLSRIIGWNFPVQHYGRFGL